MGKECKRQKIWAEIRKQKECFTLNSLSKCKVDKGTIDTFLIGLRKAGFIAVAEQKVTYNGKVPFRENIYSLKVDVGIDAPRVTREGKVLPPDINQDLWRSMKILKEFSAADLLASTPQKTTLSNIQTYCFYLVKAKYLKRTKDRYQFIRNTGAKAPKINRIKSVFDQNLKKVVWQEENDD